MKSIRLGQLYLEYLNRLKIIIWLTRVLKRIVVGDCMMFRQPVWKSSSESLDSSLPDDHFLSRGVTPGFKLFSYTFGVQYQQTC